MNRPAPTTWTPRRDRPAPHGIRQLLGALFIFLVVPAPAAADLYLPVASGTVTSGVGWRVDPFGSGKLAYHRGIDIAVPVGTPVRATRGGRVAFAGDHGGHGATIIIEGDNGDKTLYGHNSALTVQQGTRVEPGTVIAFSGNSGRSTGPHVHYEEMRGRSAETAPVPVREAVGPPLLQDVASRNIQEQRMNDAVNSILRNIGSSPVTSASAGRGG